MMSHPKLGTDCQIWYARDRWEKYGRKLLPYHGQLATVILPSRGRPRNHMVSVGGRLVIVPCGNLRRPP